MKKKKYTLLFLLLVLALACRFSPKGIVIPPPTEDYGVICFIEFSDAIVANAPNLGRFYSRNGGLTWQQEGFDYSRLSEYLCYPNKELRVPPDGMVRYRFNPGENIEVSMNRGQTWEVAYDLSQVQWESAIPADPERDVIPQPGPLDAMIDPNSGNLLLAMGHAGILLRLPSGEWHWVKVGQYAHDLSSPTLTPIVKDGMLDGTQQMASVQIPPDVEIDTENGYVDAMAFSPDGRILAASGVTGGIKLFDLFQNDLLYWQQWGQDGQNSRVYGAVFSRDGKTLVTFETNNVDQPLKIWDVESWALNKATEGYQTNVLATGVVADKQYLAIGHGHQMKLIQLPEGMEITTISGHLGYITSLYFIPGTPFLAMGSSTCGVEIWDIEKNASVNIFPPTIQPDDLTSNSLMVHALGYDPSENVVVVLLADGRLNAWEVATGELSRDLVLHVPHGWYVNTGVFSKDGRLVAVGMYDGPLLLFDSRTGQVLSRQWTYDGTLTQLEFSPEDEWLAAGYVGGDIKIWQVERLIHQD